MPYAIVAGRKLYYEVHGEGDAPPLLLVMGMGGSCRGWLPLQVPEFQKTRRTIVFDHRGIGGSDDTDAPFTTADLADDAAALLDALAIPRADVLGAFMGGMAAQELALRRPELVDRLLLVGTWARPDAKRRLLLEHWRDLARANAPREVLIRERLLWTLQDETLEQRDLIDAMVSFFTRDEPAFTPDIFARQCEACLAHDSADRLRGILRPTLVVCGRHDAFTPPKFSRELADEIPEARLVTLHHGGHVVMVEDVERFNHIVLQFLDEER
jgi:pimeloyl-ACP methyl ester carboxylesterase